MLCYLADISSMCRLASWQAETTGALGMLSVQEISFILINAAPNPSPAILPLVELVYFSSFFLFFFPVSVCLSLLSFIVFVLASFKGFPFYLYLFFMGVIVSRGAVAKDITNTVGVEFILAVIYLSEHNRCKVVATVQSLTRLSL